MIDAGGRWLLLNVVCVCSLSEPKKMFRISSYSSSSALAVQYPVCSMFGVCVSILESPTESGGGMLAAEHIDGDCSAIGWLRMVLATCHSFVRHWLTSLPTYVLTLHFEEATGVHLKPRLSPLVPAVLISVITSFP